MQIKVILTGVAGMILVTALPAAAVVKVATFSGTIANGYDGFGLFASPGSSLAGYSYVAAYTYDMSLGSVQSTDGVTYTYVYGGAAFSNGSPMISSKITINGTTRHISGAWLGYAYTDTSPLVQYASQDYFNDGTTITEGLLNNDARPVGAPASLNQDIGPVVSAGGYGSVEFVKSDSWTGLTLEVTSATFGSEVTYAVGGVPEPKSWALMVTGFGLIGGAMRRRGDRAMPAR